MVEILSEIKILPGNMPDVRPRIIEPIMKVLKKKKTPEMLEEQIRDYLPCDVEPKEENDEEL